MSQRQSRSFRPAVDRAEDRFLATVHPLASHLGAHAVAATIRHAAHVQQHDGLITAEGMKSHHKAHQPRPSHGRPPVILNGGGGGQGGLPSNYNDWGVITIWNTTNQRVTFSISASTYQAGKYFNFTLRPGQFQSYYAAFSDTKNVPAFRVSFDPIN